MAPKDFPLRGEVTDLLLSHTSGESKYIGKSSLLRGEIGDLSNCVKRFSAEAEIISVAFSGTPIVIEREIMLHVKMRSWHPNEIRAP
jgi:hypothetical protein